MGGGSIPKIIENVRESILVTAKKQLHKDGYAKLALRNIAKACSIAVGTIYNYFPSKDMLVAYIMLEDWEDSLRKMKSSCENTADLTQGFEYIYQGIVRFSETYNQIWLEYSFSGNPKYSFSEYHMVIRGQISEMIQHLFKRYEKDHDNDICAFLAESLITAALQEDMDFSIIKRVVAKLYDL